MNRESLLERLGWFHKNLGLIIEDLVLEEKGKEINLFFDTIDVRTTVLGMQEFYDIDGKLQTKGFREDITLVRCLAADGWLGKIKMLPPHQGEFLALLNIDFGVRLPKADIDDYINEFIEALIDAGIIGLRQENIKTLSVEERLKYVSENVRSAVDLFKTLEMIRGLWQHRLSSWRRDGILELNFRDFDYSKVIRTFVFTELKRSFDKKRPDPKRRINNFADAIALSILITLVHDFTNNESNIVPRFLVSTESFRNVINQTVVEEEGHAKKKGTRKARVGVEKLLTYEYGGGKIGTVLRENDYFVFKAAFRPAKGQAKYFTKPDDLKSLYAQIDGLIQFPQYLSRTVIDRITFLDRPLWQLISELRDLSFFGNVWMPFASKEALEETHSKLKSFLEELREEAFQKAVEDEIKDTKALLNKNAAEYQWIKSLWRELQDKSDEQKRRMKAKELSVLTVFRDFGLLRFNFPEHTHEKISQTNTELLGDDQTTEKDVRSWVVSTCRNCLRGSDVSADDLCVALSVLWILKLDKYIIQLLEDNKRFQDFSLRLLYAAALYRSIPRADRGDRALHELENEFARLTATAPNGELCVGMAYAYFQRWRNLGYDATWRLGAVSPELPKNQFSEKFTANAIKLAREAFELLPPESLKSIYALNLYLYYMIEGGDEEYAPQMGDAVSRLAAFQLRQDLWGFRYDDTLARYFHRIACQSQTKEQWDMYMKTAKRHIEDAHQKSIIFAEEQVEWYLTKIEIDFSRGYVPKSRS